MNIHVNTDRPNYQSLKTSERTKENEHQTQITETPTTNSRVDQYTPSEKVEPVTYKKPTIKPDTKTVERLKAESEQYYQRLQDLVKKLLERQGYTLADLKNNPSISIEVDEDTRLEAQAAISEGGEYSIENVSDRLVNFAIAISGGDKSKLDIIKGAIEDGFRAAEEAFGGTLPDISHQTLQATMDKLDKWANEDE